jgi:hypothetical protein
MNFPWAWPPGKQTEPGINKPIKNPHEGSKTESLRKKETDAS